MTETQWNACVDPETMVDFLRSTILARKLRLFSVACCRRLFHILTDPRSRALVDLAEQIADDRGARDRTGPIVHRAGEVIHEAFGLITGRREELEALLTSDQGACAVPFFLIWRMEIEAFHDTFTVMRYAASRMAGDDEAQHQCNLLRCVVGNPFRSVTLNPTWLTPAVKQLAEGIYEERAFDRMPILGDALEEAGCSDVEILTHCRQPGEHVRGCWLVDLVLGKS